MADDRDRSLVQLVTRSARGPARILDVGCGDGSLAQVMRKASVPIAAWTGLDVDTEALHAAADGVAWATFVEASADAMPFEDGAFDIVIASTLFSSLTARLERSAAREIERVTADGGWLIWYDLRYNNPRNPAVHGLARRDVSRLFPEWRADLRSMTLAPPIARRLGVATPVLYPVLHAIPALRTHLVGRLQRRG